jgi:antitoxin component of RelBE/YafQ-DinJ toxin-antitoxin module
MEQIVTSTQVSVGTREAAAPVLKREGLTVSAYLRLALEALVREEKVPFDIPEESRNANRRRHFSTTFFG